MRRGAKCPCNGLEVAVQIGAIRRTTTLKMSLEFEEKADYLLEFSSFT
jgi:hypothetical protein